jgi:hypothetical protein
METGPHPWPFSLREGGRVEGECRRTPGDWLGERERRDPLEFFGRELERVDPQPVDWPGLQRGGEGREFLAQQARHALEEEGRDGKAGGHATIIMA